MQNLLTEKGMYIKRFMVFEMAFRVRKVSGTFEKRAPVPMLEKFYRFHTQFQPHQLRNFFWQEVMSILIWFAVINKDVSSEEIQLVDRMVVYLEEQYSQAQLETQVNKRKKTILSVIISSIFSLCI